MLLHLSWICIGQNVTLENLKGHLSMASLTTMSYSNMHLDNIIIYMDLSFFSRNNTMTTQNKISHDSTMLSLHPLHKVSNPPQLNLDRTGISW